VSCLAHLDRILFAHNAAVLSRLEGGSRPANLCLALSATSHETLAAMARERNVDRNELARQLLESILGVLSR
jgi:hypothetical protein